MDIDDMRTLITVLTFMAFIAIAAWAWSGRRREEFEHAARMALDDDSTDSMRTHRALNRDS